MHYDQMSYSEIQMLYFRKLHLDICLCIFEVPITINLQSIEITTKIVKSALSFSLSV